MMHCWCETTPCSCPKVFNTHPPPLLAQFYDGPKQIVTIGRTGEVMLGEGVTLTEASKLFWQAVGGEVYRLRALIAQVEWQTGSGDCIWCGRAAFDGHTPDCPAFSAPGVVR